MDFSRAPPPIKRGPKILREKYIYFNLNREKAFKKNISETKGRWFKLGILFLSIRPSGVGKIE